MRKSTVVLIFTGALCILATLDVVDAEKPRFDRNEADRNRGAVGGNSGRKNEYEHGGGNGKGKPNGQKGKKGRYDSSEEDYEYNDSHGMKGGKGGQMVKGEKGGKQDQKGTNENGNKGGKGGGNKPIVTTKKPKTTTRPTKPSINPIGEKSTASSNGIKSTTQPSTTTTEATTTTSTTTTKAPTTSTSTTTEATTSTTSTTPATSTTTIPTTSMPVTKLSTTPVAIITTPTSAKPTTSIPSTTTSPSGFDFGMLVDGYDWSKFFNSYPSDDYLRPSYPTTLTTKKRSSSGGYFGTSNGYGGKTSKDPMMPNDRYDYTVKGSRGDDMDRGRGKTNVDNFGTGKSDSKTSYARGNGF